MQKKLRPEEREASKNFPRLARKFCMLVTSSDQQELHRFLTKVASLLGELYSVAFLLPDISPATYGTTTKNPVSKKKLAHRLRGTTF
jgi:Domain of unknown function (DUF5063)